MANPNTRPIERGNGCLDPQKQEFKAPEYENLSGYFMEHVLSLQDIESKYISLFELRGELPRGKGASVILHSEKSVSGLIAPPARRSTSYSCIDPSQNRAQKTWETAGMSWEKILRMRKTL